MKANDVFPSKYLKAEELEEDLTVTIKAVELETLKNRETGRDEEKPAIHFREDVKALLCNKTNWTLIAKQHGDESDDWIGKQITLTVMDVEAFGDIVSAIRVKPARKGKAAPTNGRKPSKSEEPISPKDQWSAFCKQIGADAPSIAASLGTDKVSEWIAAEPGRTLEQAMELVKAEVESLPF